MYYLHPTDAELRKLAGIPHPKPKPKPKEGDNKRGKHKRKRAEEPVEDKTFTVPRNIELQVSFWFIWGFLWKYFWNFFILQLETAKIFPKDVLQLKFFTEFVWLVDYSVFVLVVYIITEVGYYLEIFKITKLNQLFLIRSTVEFSLKEIKKLTLVCCGAFYLLDLPCNYSWFSANFWLSLLTFFDLFTRKSLCSVTSLYFWNTEAAAERSLVLVGGSFCFVLALGLLLIDESNLEIGLDAAYSAFNASASEFLEQQTMDSEYNISYIR